MGQSFVIEELTPPGASGAAAPRRFEWNTTNRASFQGPWPGGLQVRKAVDRPPGTAEVNEQVMGLNQKPWTVRGEWDDRFGGVGFAQATLDAFRALVARASLVRVTMGVESVTGLIDEFDYERRYVRDDGTWWRIGYSFTVSQHTGPRNADPQPVKARPSASPSRLASRVAALQNAVALAHARAPRHALLGASYAGVNAAVEAMLEAVDQTSAVIDTRFTPIVTPSLSSGAAKAAQAFLDVAISAVACVSAARALTPAAALAYETVATAADFIAWTIGVQSSCLAMAAAARGAAAELRQRIAPDGIAVYRPTDHELLASISMRYYRTPHRWRDIMRRNKLRSPILAGGELLVIPA